MWVGPCKPKFLYFLLNQSKIKTKENRFSCSLSGASKNLGFDFSKSSISKILCKGIKNLNQNLPTGKFVEPLFRYVSSVIVGTVNISLRHR